MFLKRFSDKGAQRTIELAKWIYNNHPFEGVWLLSLIYFWFAPLYLTLFILGGIWMTTLIGLSVAILTKPTEESLKIHLKHRLLDHLNKESFAGSWIQKIIQKKAIGYFVENSKYKFKDSFIFKSCTMTYIHNDNEREVLELIGFFGSWWRNDFFE